MTRGDDDGLLSRWSRRKRAIAEEGKAEVPPDETDHPVAVDVPETDPAADETEGETLTRLGLPAPESLGIGDDFSGFMKSGVPDYLRRRALRRLWRSNPLLANLDGLNDYDEDFTSPEETGKILKSAYQIGRGFLRDTPDETETPETPDAVDTPVEVAAITDDSDQEIAADENPVDPVIPPERQASASEQPQSEEQPNAARPRRMRFKT